MNSAIQLAIYASPERAGYIREALAPLALHIHLVDFGNTDGLINLPLHLVVVDAEQDPQAAYVCLAKWRNSYTGLPWPIIMLVPDDALTTYQRALRVGAVDALAWDDMARLPQLVWRQLHHAGEDRLNFLHALLLATSTAAGVDDALQTSMRLICEAGGWRYGEVWMPQADGLLHPGPAHIIQAQDAQRLTAFRDASLGYTFAPDEGVPGRAWQHQVPSWTENVQQLSAEEFLRLEPARRAGVHTVIGVPVVNEGEVLAVLVFMATRVLRQDARLLDLLSTALQQIGPLIRQHQTTEALRENEKQLKNAQAIAHLGSWTLDLDSGKVEWSDEFYRICGLEPGSVPPSVEGGQAAIHPEDRDWVSAIMQRCLTDQTPYSIEKRLIRPNGEVRWGHSQGNIVLDAHEKPIKMVGVTLDITERKENELALARSMHRLSALHDIDKAILQADSLEEVAQLAIENLLHILPAYRVTILTINPAQASAYILATYQNDPTSATTVPAGQTYAMHAPDVEALSKQLFLLVDDLNAYPNDTARMLYAEGVRSIMSIGLKQQGELIGALNLHANQADFFTDEYQQVALEVASQLAICLHTSQLHAQVQQYAAELEDRVAARTAELAEVTQRLQLATQASQVGIWDQDIVNGTLMVDDNTLRQYGLDPASIGDRFDDVPEVWARYIHPDDQVALLDAMQQALHFDVPYNVEFRIHLDDDTQRYLKASAVVLRDEQGDPVRMVGAHMDITDQKEAEAALKRALEQEKELGDLKSRFVSMASHEFRTPLAAIMATAESLLNYRARMLETQIDQRLHKIIRQVAYMRNIMEDLLQLARLQAQAKSVTLRRTPHDLDALCREVIDLLSSEHDHPERIVYTGPPQALMLDCDKQLLFQVVNNLIGNALKYSEQVVTVTLDHTPQAARLRVHDDGIGVPAKDLPRLFDPFHRAENVGTISGTGLGLSITKEAIEMHGGQITLETDPTQGTTFEVLLPFQDNESL